MRLFTLRTAGSCTAEVRTLRDLQVPCLAVLLLLLLLLSGSLVVSESAVDLSSMSQTLSSLPLQGSESCPAVTLSLPVRAKRACVRLLAKY